MPLTVILLEDNPADVELVNLHLEEVSFKGKISHTDSLEGAVDLANKKAPDVVLLDLDVTDSRGLDTLDGFRARHPTIPVVVLTGRNDPENALEALRRGAHDYVVKDNADGPTLKRAIEYAHHRGQDSEQKTGEGSVNLHISDGWVAPQLVDQYVANDRRVIWVSLNRSYDRARKAIKSHDNVFIVDGSMSSITPERVDGVAFVPSPSALEAIGLRINRIGRTMQKPVEVVVDSLDVILMHTGRDETREFCHYLANAMRMAGFGAQFMISNPDAAKALENDIQPFMDQII